MPAGSAAVTGLQDVPNTTTGLPRTVAAALACPFDCVLIGMVGAGLGIEAICAYLNLSRDGLHDNLIRLDLPTPHDRPRRKAGRRAWSDDDICCAIGWRRAGIHPESIGPPLGRSAVAVRSKLHRIGVPAPPRKMLRKVDPATLSRVRPDFGFPSGDADIISPSVEGLAVGSVLAAGETAATAPPWDEPVPRPPVDALQWQTPVAAPTQPELDLIAFRPIVADMPADVAAAPTTDLPPVQTTTRATAKDAGKTPVVGPAELVERFQVADPGRHPDTDESYLRWLTLLYLGGLHYKAIAAYVGRSASAVQSILNRMQMPRDTDRTKFSWSCDLECGVATLEGWNYVLQRCGSNPDLPPERRPFFWRPANETRNRKRRFARLRDNEIDSYFKHKQTQSVSIVTRAELDARQRAVVAAETVSGARSDARFIRRLHGPAQGSLPILAGAQYEKFNHRGHPPPV